MRIERIEVDGFGRFHDARWSLGEGITVLLGANETGKTTLLNALRALLFGFDATRDGRTWYPALAGGRRGGRLLLRTAGGERWTVERHGERGGAGALAVRAPNGNQGGQETLDRLLRGADRDLFTNIFAFGLGELQTFTSLSADGVRGRIYGAGAGLGGTSAIDLERRLRQQLDMTFLPRGRERPLNQLLARIEELRGEIADLARQPEEHEAAHRQREEHRARAAAIRVELRAERERAARLGRVLEAGPAAVELGLVTDELAAGDPALDAFPADAMPVLDRRIESLAEAQAALAAIDDELSRARAERATVTEDDPVLAQAEAILALRDEQLADMARRVRRQELEAAAVRHAAAFAEQVARAGGIDADGLLILDDSIVSVEQTRDLEQRLTEARSVATDAARRRTAAAEELEARQREMDPTDVSPEDTADRVAALDALDDLRVRRAVADAHRSPAGVPFPLGPLAAAGGGLVALLVGLAAGQPALGALAGAVVAVVVLLVTRGPGAAADLERLDAERRELLVRAGLEPTADEADVRAAAAEIAAGRARVELAREYRAGLDVRRIELERREREASASASALADTEASWRRWLQERSLPEALSPEAARQVLAAAGIARRAAAERDGHRELIGALDAESAAYGGHVDALTATLGAPAPLASRRDAMVAALVDRLERAREAARRAAAIDTTLRQLAGRREAAAELVAERSASLDAHLGALGCRDADELRAREDLARARRALVARSRELEERLAGAAGSVEAIGALVAEARAADPAAAEAGLADARTSVERLEEEEREVLSRIGALDARIRQLEAAEELGARRQELAALQGQAAALARDWAVRGVALRLLEETRARYERERQPGVVRAATEHFERVTGGRYTRIVAPPGSQAVRVETEGGEHRSTDELSRGTSEQLYLALRFGLIEEFARQAEPLPVVMDDILVNFDADRAARAAAAIRELAARHQVLYFTCHPWTAELLDPDGRWTLPLG